MRDAGGHAVWGGTGLQVALKAWSLDGSIHMIGSTFQRWKKGKREAEKEGGKEAEREGGREGGKMEGREERKKYLH